MNHLKDYMAGAIRQQILELQKLLSTLEDNSHLGFQKEFDMGLTVLHSVEVRLKNLRSELKSNFLEN